jgi:hypothetical protein
MIEKLLTQTPKNFAKTADFKLSDTSKSRIQKAVEENYKNN